MTYKGYRIDSAEKQFPRGITVKGIGVYKGDELLTLACNNALAKQLIDQRVKMGIWEEQKR